MKVWGIITTVLLVAAIGLGGWLYVQNKDLKNQKSKAESDLSATKSSYDKKISNANKKIQVLTLFFSGATDTDTMNQAYNLIKEINNATLTADYTAMQTPGQGNAAGTKMMQDLISAAATDLK